jgi:hypothetical protein
MVAGVLAIGMVYVALPVFATAHRRFFGPRFVTCPETLRPSLIELDARHAAFTSVFGRPRFRIAQCSRWPAHWDCDQDCTGCLRECSGRETGDSVRSA